ncbi:MAG: hypothetical protein H0W08_18280 [Acidobacteria bacterium]|nr:hypothetical protein [Acidobacteriota bacterium]
MHHLLRAAVIAAGFLSGGTTAYAQTTVVLPDTSQTTDLSVSVSEQARVTVPSGVSFIVANVGAATLANGVAVTLEQIVLASASKQLLIALRANASAFTPPSSGTATWAAADVSWNAPSWTAASGAAGTLGSATFNTVATCDAGATACSTTALLFTLAPKPSVQRSGTHILVVTWKVESIGS